MAAADGVFKSICLSGCDTEIDRRPYHRNCSCALHRSRDSDVGRAQKSSCPHGSKKVSFSMRKSWSEGCLAMASSSAESSPASSPAVGVVGVVKGRSYHRRLSSLDEGEEEGSFGGVFFKI